MCSNDAANVTMSSLLTLKHGAWLDDEVINYLMSHWCSKAGDVCIVTALCTV